MDGAAATSSALPPTPELMDLAGGHLWLRPVEGGPARAITTPWPMGERGGNAPGFAWSPDSRRVAVDDAGMRLAVINVITGRITVLAARTCFRNCFTPVYAWSPDGRYLAFLRASQGAQTGFLSLWDSATGATRILLRGVSAYVGSPLWSHDAHRIAIATGPLDVIHDVYPRLVTVDVTGRVVRLGKGEFAAWSPDDRLLGIIRPNYCGANTCDEDVVVRQSVGGGGAVVLARHSTSLFDNAIWGPHPGGYAFDGWLLNRMGHPVRRLLGRYERALSWRPGGARLALQTYYPYQGNPDSLILSTPSGQRDRFYTDGWNQGCGACSKDVYQVLWGQTALFAFSTRTYPTPRNVTILPRVYIASISGGSPTLVPVPRRNLVRLLGFVDGDRQLVIQSGNNVYRYEVATHRVTALVRGMESGFATAALDPRFAAPQS